MAHSFFGLQVSDEELPLLTALLQRRPGDDAPRRAYIDWLRARNDPRGELLRLADELSVARPTPEALAQRARLRALFAEVSPLWCVFVGLHSDEIFNCGDAPESDPVVRFRYECTNKWELLTPTENSEVRFCDECQQQVFRVASVAQAEDLARAGRCIAIPTPLTQSVASQLTRYSVGRPDWRRKWGEALFAGDSNRK